MDKKYSNLSPTKKALIEKWKEGKYQVYTIPKHENYQNVPLSFSQQRLWFIDQLYHDSSFYNISITFHLKGKLNISALQQSLDEILKRHEIWRTNFVLINGQPVQKIAPKLTWDLLVINIEHLSGNWEEEIKELAAFEAKKSFNLAKGSLVRATLLHLSEEEHIFLLTMHHIITDGWSNGVFLRELATLYAAFCTNQPFPLPELPIQYADFAVWQRDHLQGELLKTQLNYWKQQLRGELPILQLPTDRPRPTVSNFIGAKQYFKFSKTLTNALNQLSRREDSTLFMTLLAAFNILLYRYTDQEDILIASPIANRNRAELEGMLGLFVNTLVLRNNLSGNPSFCELLHRVREVTLDAYAHQDLPFEMLVEELHPERDLSRNPLYEVMFVLQNSPVSVQEVSGLTLRTLEFDSGTAQLDIFLSMSQSQQGLTGFLEYNTDLFDSVTISRFISHFETLLESIVANPEQQIARLSLITAQKQEQMLVKLNKTLSDYPPHAIHQLFEQKVERLPDALALIDSSENLTYCQLNHRVNQLAHYLQKQGVTKETLVAICMERSIQMVVGILAILKAGGAYIPLDPSYPIERLKFILSDSQVSLLISHTLQSTSLVNSFGQMTVINLDTDAEIIKQESQENPINLSKADDLAYIIYTSGSTGTPKGVLGTHRGTVNGLHWLWKTYPFTQGEVCCQKTAISFVDSVWEIFAPLLQGIPSTIIPDAIVKDPQIFIETLAKQKVTRIVLVPSLLRLFLDNYSYLIKNLSQIKVWISSGEILPVKLAQTFRELMPSAKLINLYGSSEVSANVTYYDTSLLPEQAINVPIGRPIDNTQVYVLDSHLQIMPIGIIGELYISGDGLAKGYLYRPELSEEKFIENPFIIGNKLYKTGDFVRYLNDGNLEYFGRRDDQIKIRGFRVELGEIASAIAQNPDVQESVVIAQDDAQGSKRLIAYVVAKQDIAAQLLSYLQQKLPNYMLPSVVILDALPLTPNGKVDKRSLPTEDIIQTNITQSFIPPRNFTELTLVKIWENLLNTSPIGVTDNFFDLGGHSFLAVRFMTQIYDKFGHNLPISTLFENPTIEKLTEIVSQSSRENSSSPLVTIQSSGSKIPFFCMHGAGGGIHSYFNLSRRIGEEYPFYALEQTTNHERDETTSVEKTATLYLQEIRKIQPKGPYFLGGFCYGGVLAFEMAQQLQKQGQTVGLLVVIDAILSETAIRPIDSDDAKFLLRIAEEIKTQNNIDVSLPFEELRDLPLDEQVYLVNKNANFIFSDAEIKDFLSHYKIFKANVQAMRNYVPLIYPMQMILLKAKKQIIHDFESLEFHTNDPLLGWGKYSSQPIQVIEVPGDHFSMFVEPHIQELAKQLRIAIDNALFNVRKCE